MVKNLEKREKKETNKKELLKIYEDKYLSLPYKTEEGGDILLKNGEVKRFSELSEYYLSSEDILKHYLFYPKEIIF